MTTTTPNLVARLTDALDRLTVALEPAESPSQTAIDELSQQLAALENRVDAVIETLENALASGSGEEP